MLFLSDFTGRFVRSLKALLMLAACLAVQANVSAAGSEPVPLAETSRNPAQIEALQPLHSAWLQARNDGKSVMLVLGADWCDRCALLSRYLQDGELQQRVSNRFVMLPMDVGSPDSLIEVEEGAEHLPIVLLIDANMPFEAVLQSDNLLTFLPEPYEPVFDWFENVLFFSEQNLALR